MLSINSTVVFDNKRNLNNNKTTIRKGTLGNNDNKQLTDNNQTNSIME